jgi:hypothetical protein
MRRREINYFRGRQRCSLLVFIILMQVSIYTPESITGMRLIRLEKFWPSIDTDAAYTGSMRSIQHRNATAISRPVGSGDEIHRRTPPAARAIGTASDPRVARSKKPFLLGTS